MPSVLFINHILDDKNAFKLIALLAATKQQNTNPSIISAQNPGKIPCLNGRGGQRYFLWGCAFAKKLPLFLRPLALDRNDFKFASALSAIPL